MNEYTICYCGHPGHAHSVSRCAERACECHGFQAVDAIGIADIVAFVLRYLVHGDRFELHLAECIGGPLDGQWRDCAKERNFEHAFSWEAFLRDTSLLADVQVSRVVYFLEETVFRRPDGREFWMFAFRPEAPPIKRFHFERW